MGIKPILMPGPFDAFWGMPASVKRIRPAEARNLETLGVYMGMFQNHGDPVQNYTSIKK